MSDPLLISKECVAISLDEREIGPRLCCHTVKEAIQGNFRSFI